MTYNNGFPVGYQNPYYSMNNYSNNNASPPIIWVQNGLDGAKNYMMGPNQTLPLWDSENQIIYLKSTDQQGRPSIKILDYTIREEPETTISNENLVTKTDLENFKSEIENIIKNSMSGPYYRKDRKETKNE